MISNRVVRYFCLIYTLLAISCMFANHQPKEKIVMKHQIISEGMIRDFHMDPETIIRLKIEGFICKTNPNISINDAHDISFALNENVPTEHIPMVVAIMWHESHFNKRAISSAGAMGLGQIMPDIWDHYTDDINEFYSFKHGGNYKSFPQGIKNHLMNTHCNVMITYFVYQKYLKKADYDPYKALTYYYGAHDYDYIRSVLTKYFEIP